MRREKQLRHNIRKFYLYKICVGMFFSVPVMVLFWQDNGLSMTEIMVLQSLFATLTVLLELPSGYFSDRVGRKKTLLISSVSGLVAFIIYSNGHSFFHFLAGELFFALSISFASGTADALIYDTMVELGEENQFKRVWGHTYFLGLLALTISNSLGGIIGKINLRYTLYASIPFFLFTIPITLSLSEPERERPQREEGYLRDLIGILKAQLSDKRLLWIILFSGIIYAFNQSVFWFYQPYLKLSGVDLFYFGFIFASFQLAAAFSSKFSYKLELKAGQRVSLLILTLIVGGSFILMGRVVFLFSFIFCYLQQFSRGFMKVVISDYINMLTTSSVRATILSLQNMVAKLIYALLLPFLGWAADAYSITQALTLLGVITLIIGGSLLICLNRNQSGRE